MSQPSLFEQLTQRRRLRDLEADRLVLLARVATLEKWIAQLRTGREVRAVIDDRVFEEVDGAQDG